MKKVLILAVLLALLAPLGLLAQAPDATEAQAVAAAEAWLATVDAGDYGKSWDDAAKLFRNAVTKEDWERAAAGVRAPLGAVTSRNLKSKQAMTSLPGAPDGHYVVIQFDDRLRAQERGGGDRHADARRRRRVAGLGLLRALAGAETNGGWRRHAGADDRRPLAASDRRRQSRRPPPTCGARRRQAASN